MEFAGISGRSGSSQWLLPQQPLKERGEQLLPCVGPCSIHSPEPSLHPKWEKLTQLLVAGFSSGAIGKDDVALRQNHVHEFSAVRESS